MGHEVPSGWTAQGQARGCYALDPASERARLQKLVKENSYLQRSLQDILERLQRLEEMKRTSHELHP